MTKEEFDKEFKIIVDGYNEKLLSCHYEAFNKAEKPIEYIANYIKFLRDYYLITTPEDDNTEETAIKVSNLMAAVVEYDHYIELKNMLNEKELAENTIKKYQEEKSTHWKNFIQLLAINLGDGN